MRLVWKLLLLADEGDGGGERPLGEGEVPGDSVEGTSGDDGLPGADFGDFAGEGEVSGAGEADGGGEGDVAGGVDVARVSISICIPWLQCPGVPQMKYRFPGEERDMTVLPLLYV